MHHSTTTPTKAQRERMGEIKRRGCIACWKRLRTRRLADAHHLVDKGTRALSGGHDATAPLCGWHHRGIPECGHSESEMRSIFGPSMALEKEAFEKEFGSERALLEEVNQRLAKRGVLCTQNQYEKTAIRHTQLGWG